MTTEKTEFDDVIDAVRRAESPADIERVIAKLEPMNVARRRYRTDDPTTSMRAAHMVERFAASHKGRIINALKLFPYGATVDALAARTGLSSAQVHRRMPELHAMGVAVPDGEARSSSGCFERIWRLV